MAKCTSEDSAIVEHHVKAERSKKPRQQKARGSRSIASTVKYSDEFSSAKTKKKGQSAKTDVSSEEKLLTTMLRYYVLKEARTFEQLSEDDHGVERKSWPSTFKAAKENGYVEANSDDEYLLTKSGLEKANTFRKDDPLKMATTDDEHHSNLKKVALKRGPEILDVLLVETEALTNKEIAAKLGCQEGAHSFFYGLQGLKTLGIVGVHPDCKGRSKKLCLTGKAFLDGKQREYELNEELPKKSVKKEKENSKKAKTPSAKGKAAGKKDELKDTDENQNPQPDEDAPLKNLKTSTKKKKASKKQVSKREEKEQEESKEENNEASEAIGTEKINPHGPKAAKQFEDVEPKKAGKKRSRDSLEESQTTKTAASEGDNMEEEAENAEPMPKKARNSKANNKKASTKANDTKEPGNTVDMEVDQMQDIVEAKQAEDTTAMEVESQDEDITVIGKTELIAAMEVEEKDEKKEEHEEEPKADNNNGESKMLGMIISRPQEEAEKVTMKIENTVNTGDKEEDKENKEVCSTKIQERGIAVVKIGLSGEAKKKVDSNAASTKKEQLAIEQDIRKEEGDNEGEGNKENQKVEATSSLFNDVSEAKDGAMEQETNEGDLSEGGQQACNLELCCKYNSKPETESTEAIKSDKPDEKGLEVEAEASKCGTTMEVANAEAAPKTDKVEAVEGVAATEPGSTNGGETEDFAETAEKSLFQSSTGENFNKIGIGSDSNSKDE